MRCHAVRPFRNGWQSFADFSQSVTDLRPSMGSPDRSERIVLLRRSVLDALERAREREGGRLSVVYEQLEPAATREGLTRDDFYRAGRRETVDKLSQSKLERLRAVLEAAGLVAETADAGAGLVHAIEALSRTALLPERLRRELPRRLLCFRRSYLVPGAVNVSHVEITYDDLVIHYRETRAGSLGSTSQRSEIRGTVLHHEDLADLLYVVGHNEFRTNFAVEEAVSTRSHIVVLSVLRPCEPPSLEALEGVHVGVTPDNNPDHPAMPYAARVVLVRTDLDLVDAARAGLIQNHPIDALIDAPGWDDATRRRLVHLDVPVRLSGGCDPQYGLMLATGASAPSPRSRTGRRKGD